MARLTARDLMTSELFALDPEDHLGDVRDLMADRHVRHVPVVDRDGALVGLVTHRDLLRAGRAAGPAEPPFAAHLALERVTVGEVMTTEVETVSPGVDIRRAARVMLEHKFGCLPVVEDGRLVGILTESDFVRLLADGE